MLAGSRFIPYSPRWLLAQDRRAEAFSILKRLHAHHTDPNDLLAREEFLLMEKQYTADKALTLSRNTFFEMFRTAANRRGALTSGLLMGLNQMIGTYVIANYGVLIYASLGLPGKIPLLLNACWVTFTIFGNTCTALFIDRFGRRPFLLIGTTGCLLSMVFLAALTATFIDTDNKSGKRGDDLEIMTVLADDVDAGLSAAVFFIWTMIFFWAFFMDATQFVYVSEIWPNHLRATGTAFGIAMFFLTSEITLVAAPVGLNTIGWKCKLSHKLSLSTWLMNRSLSCSHRTYNDISSDHIFLLPSKLLF